MKQQKITNNLLVVFFCLSFYSCKKGGSTNSEQQVPLLTIAEASQLRSTVNSTLIFTVYLDKSTANNVSVDYTLIDGTAIAPKDYIATSGTITIPANQTTSTLAVQIKGDPADLRQPNLEFTVLLSNPKFCKIPVTSIRGTIITEDGSFLPTDNTGYTTPLAYPGYTLAWSDEFSGSALNPVNWNQETGNGTGGWGNNELEYYTSRLQNTFLSSGNLIIEARKEAIGGFNYSSGRMTTQNKKVFKFGRIDIRAKLPVGKGIWPALWMLGANIPSVGWPACGEIDIMELVGNYPGRVTGTMHWKAVNGTNVSKGANYNLSGGDFSQQFHVFTIVWEQDIIKWYVDDQLYLTNTLADVGAANYPFNANQFFIFNVAVGGDWPGSPDVSTAFPQRMFVDYIRVFQ